MYLDVGTFSVLDDFPDTRGPRETPSFTEGCLYGVLREGGGYTEVCSHCVSEPVAFVFLYEKYYFNLQRGRYDNSPIFLLRFSTLMTYDDFESFAFFDSGREEGTLRRVH